MIRFGEQDGAEKPAATVRRGKQGNAAKGAATIRLGESDVPAERAAPKKRGLFSGRTRGDAELRKLIKHAKVSRVLEIFVGDGSRTCSALQTLSASQQSECIDYTVIDPFEADAGVALKSFHRRIRKLNAQVRVIPGSMETGLQRVAWTIGTVDLVLIGSDESQWSSTAIDRLGRVCHSETVVLVHDGQRWRRSLGAGASAGRVAA